MPRLALLAPLLVLLLAGRTPAAQPRLIFSDDFARKEIGDQWRSTTGTWKIADGALIGTEKAEDGHGAVTQTYLDFSDLILEFRFKLGESPSFNVVIDDRHYDGSHAGHICRVSVQKKGILLGDDKTGVMEKEIFKMRRDPDRKEKAEKLLEGKRKRFPATLDQDQWHTLRVAIIGETLSASLDGKEAGALTSPGIAHRTKTDFGFTVKGPGARFDDVKAWLPATTGHTYIYGASRDTKELLAVRHERGAEADSLTGFQSIPLDLSAGPITWHPDHRMIYLADTRSKEDGGARGYAFTVKSNGHLTNKQPIDFHHGYAYLALDRTRRFLLCASYREGDLDIYRLDEAGMPGERVATRHVGRDKAHAILTSPDNRSLYVPYVKDQNALYQYRFDEKTGSIAPLVPASLEPPQGSGPRHLAFHPALPVVYFSNEQHVGASSYRRTRNGTLQFLQMCDVFPAGPPARQSASDIALTRGGRFLFTGLRGPADGKNGVNRYAIDRSGSMRHLGRTPTGTTPWCLQLSPDEQRLFVTTSTSGHLTAFDVGADGSLTRKVGFEWGKGFRDLVVVDGE